MIVDFLHQDEVPKGLGIPPSLHALLLEQHYELKLKSYIMLISMNKGNHSNLKNSSIKKIFPWKEKKRVTAWLFATFKRCFLILKEKIPIIRLIKVAFENC